MSLCQLRKLSISMSIVGCLFAASGAAQAPVPDPSGAWETIDDSTHRVKSLVSLAWQGNQLAGQIVSVLDSAAPPHALCTRCRGARRNQPIEGMIFMWGLTRGVEANVYDGGVVLDPSNGKEYRCRLRLQADGQLEVRGFVGLPLFGRSQVWRRPSSPQASPTK